MKMSFGEDTYFAILEPDKKTIVPLVGADNHHDFAVEVDCRVVHFAESKLIEQFGEEWTYQDCWDYIAQHGFDLFAVCFSE